MTGVRITRDVTQAVRDTIDIVDIASDMTRLERRGKRYIGLCPFHKEKSPSFSVDPDNGLYYCFGCGAGGDAIGLFMQSSGDDFPAAIEALARRYGIELPRARPAAGPAAAREERRDLTHALEAAVAFFSRQLRRSDFARDYLEKRDMPPELVERYGLGYAPEGWDNLLKALQGRVPIADLIDSGLVGRSPKSGKAYDRFRHRLIFPIHNPGGRLVGFGGRTLGDDKAKYVNTAETAEFHKGRLLYGFHLAKRTLREGRRAVLVEGYFDVLGAAACGLEDAVAGMGTALTPEQAKLLTRYADEVVVAYDGDAAGEKAFERSLPILIAAGLYVRRARFPAGHDPDSLRTEAGPAAVRDLIADAEDGVRLEIARLVPPSGRRSPAELSRAAQAMVEILRPLRDEMVRREYTRHAAEQLGVPEDVLLKRLGPRLYSETVSKERRGQVLNQEEKALQCLLQADSGPLPSPLPPKEIFFDEDCRNIYAAFCALYMDGGESPPKPGAVLAKLDNAGGSIDRMAYLLLEEAPSGGEDMETVFSLLVRRFNKQRSTDLARQIRQAEEQGDVARLAELIEERKELTRSLHPEMTGRWW